MTQRIAVFPADRHSLYEEHGYSAAIRSGDLLFVSGQVGSHTDGTPEPDFQKQVRLAFENLKATLTAAGCTFDDIVDVTTFHTDPEQQLNDVMAVKQEIFAHPPYPNWTAVGVTWLAGFDFEIKVIARIPGCLFSVKPVALYRFYFIHPCPSSCMINMQSPNISN